jgi:hypothetical protein
MTEISPNEVAWSWRCRAPNDRTTCLVCDAALPPHALRYCSADHARKAHKKAGHLFGELYHNPCGDEPLRKRKRRRVRRASR